MFKKESNPKVLQNAVVLLKDLYFTHDVTHFSFKGH